MGWVNKPAETVITQSPVNDIPKEASSSAAEEKPLQDSKFKVGDMTTLTLNSNLRDKPGGELIQTLSREETLELTEGPLSAKGSWWWKAKVASTSAEKADQLLGLTGYMAEGYWLKKK